MNDDQAATTFLEHIKELYETAVQMKREGKLTAWQALLTAMEKEILISRSSVEADVLAERAKQAGLDGFLVEHIRKFK